MANVVGIGVFNSNLLKVVGPVILDNVMNETHDDEAFIPEYALENASIESEHIATRPPELSLDFRLSSQDTSHSSYGLRAALIYNLLVFGFQNRALYTLVTRHRLYTNMAITKLHAEHRGPYTGSLEGFITFKQLSKENLFSSLIGTAQLAQDGTQYKAADTVNLGIQKLNPNLPDPILTATNTNFGLNN